MPAATAPAPSVSVREAWREVLRVLVPNRIAVFIAMWLVMVLWPPSPPSPGVTLGDRPNAGNLLFDGWFRWDVHWYWQIARNGYANTAQNYNQHDVQFFPGFPLLVHLFNFIIPDTYWAGMVASNVCLALAAYLLFRLVEMHHGVETARKTLWWMLIYPWAFILSAMYTESLMLAAMLGAFYFGEKERWWLAGLCASVAGVTRIVGFTSAAGLVVLYLEKKNWKLREIRADVLGIGLSALLPALHFLYLKEHFGDPWVFIAAHNVPGWGGDRTLSQIWPAVLECLSPSNLMSGQAPMNRVMHLFGLAAGIAGCIACIRRNRAGYGVWGLCYLALSLRVWDGIGRFVVVVFPMYIGAALWLRKPEYEWALSTLGCCLMGVLMLLFSHWHFVG